MDSEINWFELKAQEIDHIKSYIEIKQWALGCIRKALLKNDMPLDVLQDLWRQQRLILAEINEEYNNLKIVKGGQVY